ncbi:MAG: DNRLRE domain-containing protein [Cellulosilyticaceae bacterium]
MDTLHLPCKTSLAYSSHNDFMPFSDIMLGYAYPCHYWSYLYFNTFTISPYTPISSAIITLFKIPTSYEKHVVLNATCIPTLEYMTPYTYCYNSPSLAREFTTPFFITPNMSYTEIDVTTIVQAWVSGTLPNKGLLLFQDHFDALVHFGAASNPVPSLQPVLDITIATTPAPPIIKPVYPLPLQIAIL